MSADTFVNVQVGYSRFFIDKRYTNLKPVGDGSYGFVASGIDAVTGQKVAIKKIKDVFNDVVDAKRILRELKLLRHFNSHENIITIYDIMAVPAESFQDIYIVTNLMESDLERIIRSQQTLTDQHFQYFLYQLLRALKYVHSANVLHRDLKPSNLLVNANCDLALCDFGLARGFDVEGKDTLTEYVVTRWYRAPELLCESTHYGKGVDVWSVGCIFAELLVHEAFFRGENPQHQLEVIVSKMGCPPKEKLGFIESPAARAAIWNYVGHRPPPFNKLFPAGCNPAALDILQRMLQFHPDDRISVEEALEHPYLRDFHGQMDEPLSSNLFDFDFERTESISGFDVEVARAEVRARIFEEVLLYRPGLAQSHASGSYGDAKMGYGTTGPSSREQFMDVQDEADGKVFFDARDGADSKWAK